MENETFLTVQEAAERIGVSESAVRNATLEDRLPFTKKYGRKLIALTDLEAYRQRTQPDGVKAKGRPSAAPEDKQA